MVKNIKNFDALKLKIASPEEVLGWSYGEVTEPETINYRTQRPEKDGLFDERIFGPTKDYECYCGKYRKKRYKGVVCDKCGVEVTSSRVRRERMGHIDLAAPVTHFWFAKGVPSKLATFLNISNNKLDKVIYFTSYVVISVDEEEKNKALSQLEAEYKRKRQEIEDNKEFTKQEGEEELGKLEEEYEETRKKLKGLHERKVISEVDYYNLSKKFAPVFEAGIGAEALKKIVENLDLEEMQVRLKEKLEDASKAQRKKIYKRLRIIEGFLKNDIKPEWLFVTVLPVIPPDLRPMVQLDGGRFATSDVNDLYRRVINRNNRLKRLKELNAPEIIRRNEKRMLQEAVDALIDNSARRGKEVRAAGGQRRVLKSLADMLKGKEGRFRRNLLGKRVDYSGRSVIVAGPELELNECGLPKKMALEIFKPFVINNLIEERGEAANIKQATTMIEEEQEVVWDALDEAIEGRLVLLNRAPTLHKLSIQAFKPVLIDGLAIKLHTLVCPGYNADFDGDQMAVHLPLSEQAQKEARERMYSINNLLKPATGRSIVSPSQDMVLGSYWLTTIEEGVKGEGKAFASFDEAQLAYQADKLDLQAKVEVRNPEGEFIETSVGRIIFNSSFYPELSFRNEQMDKSKLKELVDEVIASEKIENEAKVLDKIKEVGFHYATLSGISWGMKDLKIPEEKEEIMTEAEKEVDEVNSYFEQGLLTEEERKTKVVEAWFDAVDKISDLVPENLPEGGSIYPIFESGSRGSWGQLAQMSGLKGLVVNPSGETIELPVKSSFKEGFNVLEYFISTHGARKGTTDTALKTAKSGYLTRRLVDVAQDVIVREEDCGDEEGIHLHRKDGEEIGVEFGGRIKGRTVMEDVKDDSGDTIVEAGEMLSEEQARRVASTGIEKLKVRSPLTCKTSHGICKKCFGYDLSDNSPIDIGTAVGIVAAQSIGEPGTQLTMRTFHAGGVAAGGGDITQGLPRVEDLFEKRTPQDKAILSAIDGTVVSIEGEDDENKEIVIRGPKPGGKGTRKKTYTVPPKHALWVEEGEQVQKGQQLTEGRLDLDKLFELAGARRTQRYIVKEVLDVYYSQGAGMDEKYVEVIARKMFSRKKVLDPGDTSLLPGEVVEEDEVEKENKKVEKEGKETAKTRDLILGITRTALSTESFLSAASFQRTTQTLIDASIKGKVDKLRGLKENIIVGKLIPAGTGYEKEKK